MGIGLADRGAHDVHHGAGDHHRAHAPRRPGPGAHRGVGRPLRHALRHLPAGHLPLIAPAILAGFLLSFTFSFDDFIIAFFVAGSETTLPIYIFSSIRRGVTPEINAIGTMVMAASLLLLVTAQLILRRGQAP
jgi:hypothetical protein